MNIKNIFNLLFNKSKCVKAIIVDKNKRVKSYIVKVDDNPHFSIGTRTYVINFESVFMDSGFPTYFYYIDNPNSIAKRELSKHNDPLSIEEASRKIDVSSAELYNAIEETVLAKIIRYAEDGDKKILNTIMITGGMIILVLLGGFYFLYIQLEKILLFISENEAIIQAIKDALISGVGN